MEITVIGIVVAIASIWMAFRSGFAIFSLVIVLCTVDASAAISLPALGGSSITPARLALFFLAVRVVLAEKFNSTDLRVAVMGNIWFILYAVYAVIGAFTLPKLFAGLIELPPLKAVANVGVYYAVPLQFSPQNITQSVYILGDVLLLICATLVCRKYFSMRGIVNAFIVFGCLHVLFGILDLATFVFHVPDLLGFLKNGGYAILKQEEGGFHRIAGSFSETSGYTAYGFPVLVFLTELWMRGVRPQTTGLLAAAMAAMLIASTSSSAYLSLPVYGIIIILRLVYAPGARSWSKLAIFGALSGLAVLALAAASLAAPDLIRASGDILTSMTFGKSKSESGMERAFAIQKGFEAFMVSHGLGVGVGSFRSSSLVSAIAGSMGVVGGVTFAGYLYALLPLARRESFRLQQDTRAAVGAAAAWGAVAGLVPALGASGGADPGPLFCALASIALASGFANSTNARKVAGWRRRKRLGVETPIRISPGVRARPYQF